MGRHPNPACLVGFVLTTCSTAPGIPTPDGICPPAAARRPFDAQQANALVGEFDLVVVWSQGRAQPASRSGLLHLELSDSLFRYYQQSLVTGRWLRSRSERPLSGWTEASFQPLAETTSRDPHSPGVYFSTADTTLYVGVRPRVTDEGSDMLRVLWVVPDGFGGSFTPDMGIAVIVDTLTERIVPQGGYFCARRRDA